MTWMTEFTPGRWVEVEAEIGCQRWDSGAKLIHWPTMKHVVVLDYETLGFWLGFTGQTPEGERCERYMVMFLYLCHVVEDNETRCLPATTLREP